MHVALCKIVKRAFKRNQFSINIRFILYLWIIVTLGLRWRWCVLRGGRQNYFSLEHLGSRNSAAIEAYVLVGHLKQIVITSFTISRCKANQPLLRRSVINSH